MSIYDDDNYYITFGERRQSREEWIAFGDETGGKYDPSYDAASDSDCVTGYTNFPGDKTNSTTQHSPQPQQSGCLVVILLLIISIVAACTSHSSKTEEVWLEEDTVVINDAADAVVEVDSAAEHEESLNVNSGKTDRSVSIGYDY